MIPNDTHIVKGFLKIKLIFYIDKVRKYDKNTKKKAHTY